MSKPVYKIVEYDLIGKKLYTKELMPNLREVDDTKYHGRYKFVDETGHDAYRTHLWSYTTTPPKDAFESTLEFLPYRANVKQDLPGYCKFKPQTWSNCILMVEKHAGYLQFYHEETKTVLRIAINSNFYQPIN